MPINWVKIYKNYRGKWVALLDNEFTVISFGVTAKEAFDKAQKKGINNPILTKVPKKLQSYVGVF